MTVPDEAVTAAIEAVMHRHLTRAHWADADTGAHRAALMLDIGPDVRLALEAAAPAIAAAERARCAELARKVNAAYPVTVGPAPGQVSRRDTAFPFGDYLEDIP